MFLGADQHLDQLCVHLQSSQCLNPYFFPLICCLQLGEEIKIKKEYMPKIWKRQRKIAGSLQEIQQGPRKNKNSTEYTASGS